MKKHSRELDVVDVDTSMRPAWVETLLGGPALPAESVVKGSLHVQVTEGNDLVFVEVKHPGAVDLDSPDFQACVVRAYGEIYEQLSGRRDCHPLRFWNFVPDIHRPSHDGMVRYEVFNAGRFEAFKKWYRTPDFGPRMIAASGIDPRGEDFAVQVLAGRCSGRGLENPRQRPAYRYSSKYGPMPPCFARATVVDDGPESVRGMMIVAGTASIVGEDSVHDHDLEKQLSETCANLESLVRLIDRNGHGCTPLSRFEELRVYVVDPESRADLIGLCADSFPNLERLEVMPADLCRNDLLVEVEGIVSPAPA